METVLALLISALVLVFFEVVVPGGVLGLLAFICLIAASWLAYAEYGGYVAAASFVGFLLVAGLMVYLEFKYIFNSALGRAFFLRASVEGRSTAQPTEESIVGREGETRTRLNPLGTVSIDGEPYEASSEDGYLDRGQRVKVVAKDNFRILVEKS